MRCISRTSDVPGAHCVRYAGPVDQPPPSDSPSPSRLAAALAAYAIISLLAAFTLTGKFRIVVWIFMAGLAVKSWVHSKQPH